VILLPDAENPQLVPFYSQAITSLLPTYAQIIDSRSFMEGVAGRLPFEISGSALDAAVRAEPVGELGALRVIADSPVAERAQAMAQAVAGSFVEEVGGDGIVEISIIDEAALPEAPLAPNTALVITAALILGLGLGSALAVAWDRLFGRISTSEELATATGLPVLGVIPRERQLQPGQRLAHGDLELGRFLESIRALRTNLLFTSGAVVTRGDQVEGGLDPVNSVLITGLNAGDGKSTVAANLTVMIGELGLEVLLVDGDLRRPVQHEVFGVSNDKGLSSIVLDGMGPEQLVQATGFPNAMLLPAGPPLQSRAQETALYSRQMGAIERLSDVTIIDSPPLRAGDDVRLLASVAGGVVLMVTAGAATPHQARAAAKSLEVAGARVLGTVLNRAQLRKRAGMGADYYGYRSYGAIAED
jgi:capsular exopolysaccharide synthesis family protein